MKRRLYQTPSHVWKMAPSTTIVVGEQVKVRKVVTLTTTPTRRHR